MTSGNSTPSRLHPGRRLTLLLAALIGVLLLLTAQHARGLTQTASSPSVAYAQRLFDADTMHAVDIRMPEESWLSMLADAEERYAPCTVEIDGESFANVALRIKGNSSRGLIEEYGSGRFSFKIEFDHYIAGNTYHGLDKLSLSSSFQDNSYLKDFIVYDMMAAMGVPAPLCSFVQLTVNGEPWGVYVAIEDPEEAFVRRNFGGAGQLYQPDYKRLSDPNTDVALIYTGEDPALYANIFDNAKFEVTGADQDRLIAALRQLGTGERLDLAVDVEEVLRYFVVQTFVINLDSYLGPTGHNYFLYERNGVISILPWDYNLAFGTYTLGTSSVPQNDTTGYVNFPIDTPAEGSVMLNRPLFHELMQNNTYFARYHSLYDEFLSAYFESGRFEALFDRTVQMLAPYVREDATAFCSYEDFLRGADTLRAFCLLRAESVRGQLDGSIPSTLRTQSEQGRGSFVDASHIRIEDMGNLDDLEDERSKPVFAAMHALKEQRAEHPSAVTVAADASLSLSEGAAGCGALAAAFAVALLIRRRRGAPPSGRTAADTAQPVADPSDCICILTPGRE